SYPFCTSASRSLKKDFGQKVQNWLQYVWAPRKVPAPKLEKICRYRLVSTVCPALCPPENRTTRLWGDERKAVVIPFPSSLKKSPVTMLVLLMYSQFYKETIPDCLLVVTPLLI